MEVVLCLRREQSNLSFKPDKNEDARVMSDVTNVTEVANEDFLKTASWVCGITYAILFGGSVAVQAVVNYFNKSTKGFSSDFALVGFVGFFFLLLN